MTNQYSVGNFIYDPKVYDGLNQQKDDIQFYLQWITSHNLSKVLELCCGTGRITIPLAKSGIQISGYDLNETMLNEAKLKASSNNLTIPFYQGDMRNIELNDKYQMIFIPFNSIHCLYSHNDLFKTLQSIYNHLAKDGYLIIDYFNPSISYISSNQGKAVEIANYMTKDGRSIRINQTMNYEDNTQINRIKWEYYVNDQPYSIESLDMRMFYPQELDYYIESNKFNIVNKYGDYQMNPFTNGSTIQLLICQKK
ncbi:MAG: class I SAM-dependent methyltransferase [Ignavibacteriales bacterium]|nr:class I SAM-dependent methyltransferase [Ignavibacteriales bacterium]